MVVFFATGNVGRLAVLKANSNVLLAAARAFRQANVDANQMASIVMGSVGKIALRVISSCVLLLVPYANRV